MRRFIFTLIIFCLSFNPSSLYAAWWNEERLPLPINTQEAEKETRKLADGEYDFTYYTSSQDVASIKEFYRRELSRLGWKENDILGGLSQMEGFKPDAMITGLLGENILFEKEGYTFTLGFMPQEYSLDGKTHFSIARSKEKESNKPLTEEEINQLAIPELKAKPKKEIAPVYPGATLVNLSEGKGSQDLAYITTGHIEQAASFYKTRMADYGWSLKEEKPLAQVETPAEAQNLVGEMDMWLTQLDFSNNFGDNCQVVISSVISQSEKSASLGLDMTNILVRYEEKK